MAKGFVVGPGSKTSRRINGSTDLASRDTCGIERCHHTVLTGCRIYGHHVQLDVAFDHCEAVDESRLCAKKFVNLRAIERDHLVGTELDLYEARDLARFSVVQRRGEFDAYCCGLLGRVMDVDQGAINSLRKRSPIFVCTAYFLDWAANKLRGVLQGGGRTAFALPVSGELIVNSRGHGADDVLLGGWVPMLRGGINDLGELVCRR